MRNHPTKLSIWKPLIILFLLGIAAIYFVNALNSQNWLWFQSKVTKVEPSRILVIEDGQETLVAPGHQDFLPLSQAIEQGIGSIDSMALTEIGLSDETVEYMGTEGVMLEVYFDAPIVFNTTFRAGEPTQVLIPIEGRHAGNGYFFRGAHGDWWFGAIRMSNPEPIYETVEALGYGVTLGVE